MTYLIFLHIVVDTSSLSIVKISALFIFMRFPTFSVNSYLASINHPSTLGSNFDLENFAR
jgi:hypothetical protein